MTASDLLNQLQARGIVVALAGDDLSVTPWSSLTDADRQAIRSHKADLLALLSRRPDSERCEEVIILDAIDRALVSAGRFRINTAFHKAHWRWRLELGETVIEREGATGRMNGLALSASILEEVRVALAAANKITVPLIWRWGLSVVTYPNSLGVIVAQAEGVVR